jgi:protein-tyrosine phosphatase
MMNLKSLAITTLLGFAILAQSVPTHALTARAVLPQPPTPSPHERVLPLQGGQNFRELGGYPTADGHTIRWGLLYRSGSMHWLTAADYAYLGKLGIRTVCDFRDTQERAVEAVDWPANTTPNILTDDYRNVNGIGKPDQSWTAEKARQTMIDLYPHLLAQFNGQYRRMFRELLAGHAPLAFNCTAGKDRTGVAAALLLTALGVARETVIQDYALSNQYFDPAKAIRTPALAQQPWNQLPPAAHSALAAADPSYIEAVLHVLDAHAGGADGYLHDELGLSAGDLTQLRQMYTE